MKLFYKIEFKSTNLYYKKIIQSLIDDFGINAKVKQYIGYIIIICEDSEDKIESFFDFLGKNLPLSIFIGKSYVIDFFDESKEELEDFNIKQNISMFTNKEILDMVEENKNIDFSNDINIIKDGKVSKLETHNGYKDIFLPSKALREEFEEKGLEVKLLICNLSKLQSLAVISQEDIKLLCSVERPLVKLRFNILKNQEKEFSSSDYIYAKLPDDKESILFANALKNEGIDYLLYTIEESLQDGIRATYNDEQNIIISGDKAIFPKYDYTLEKRFDSSKEFFEQNGGVAKTTIKTMNKRLKPIMGVYFSKKADDSSIFVSVPGKGFKEIISIPNVYYDIENAMEEIASIDENCERLVTNYKLKFPELFEKSLPKEDADGFEAIMDFCAFVLGLKDANEFENLAYKANVKSGMQIDMKLVKIDGVNYLDYRRIVQSIMSYKMADVDSKLLAFSFFESLSDLVKDNAAQIKSDIKCEEIIFCGDMFANTIFSQKCQKDVKNSLNIVFPTQYPLDK